MSEDMSRWNLFLPRPLLERVKALAIERRVSASQVVRTAVTSYLKAVDRAEAEKRG